MSLGGAIALLGSTIRSTAWPMMWWGVMLWWCLFCGGVVCVDVGVRDKVSVCV